MGAQTEHKETFTHLGTVSKVSGNSVFVALAQNVHCESCRAKSACGVSESKTKEIEVPHPSESFNINENVQVVLKKQSGMKAVFWAYIFPFILLITVLLTASLFLSEWQAGFLALAILAPYYLVLHRLNAFFQKKLKVAIVKLV